MSVAVLAGAPPALAAMAPITGKLSEDGYTVLALAKSGEARSTHPGGRRFRLRPPAGVVTLHLRAGDGTYAGPVVIAREAQRKRAVLGVGAGAELGRVEVRAGRGYARLEDGLPEEFVHSTREARARRGVPIGAGNFGRVRSRHTHGGAPGDRDLDGIPEPLDVDDDGDRVLDNLDRAAAARVARGGQAITGCGPNNAYCQPIASGFAPGLSQTVNVNALEAAESTPEQTAAQVDAALMASGALRFAPVSDSAELDCGGEPDPDDPDGWIGGLSYCTRGGTGIASAGGAGPPFPGLPGGMFDPDGDGFGTFPKPSFVAHRATSAQIKTGDVLAQRVINDGDGTETVIPSTLNFVFVTVPALVSYRDTVGNCARVAGTPGDCPTVFSYPISGGDLGTSGNGFPVSASAGEDVVVALTFWHPQRRPIPESDPPAAEWMDIGHLTYAAYAPAAGHPAIAGGCPQDAFSTADPNLGPPELPLLGTGSFADLTDDSVSNAANTLTYSLNLSRCLDANGLSFGLGEEQMIHFMAVAGATDTAEQTGISFKRQ